MFDFASKNPKEDHFEYLQIFEHLTNPSQQIVLEGENETLTELMKDISTNKQTIIDEVIFIAELISKRKCLTFVNYANCSDIKKKYIDISIKTLNEMYTCSSLLNDLISTGEEYPINLKRYLIALFEIVNNAVSYQESNFFYLYNMTQCAFNNMDAFLKKIEDKDTKSDVKKLFLVTTSNLFDVLPYAEIEKYIQFTYEDNILMNPIIDSLRSNIEGSLKHLWSEDKNSYSFDNFEVLYTKKKAQSNDEINFTDEGIAITLKQEEFLSIVDKNIIQYIVYKNYPYLSVNNTYFSNTFISVAVYNEATGEKGDIDQIDKELRPLIAFSKEKYDTKNIHVAIIIMLVRV